MSSAQMEPVQTEPIRIEYAGFWKRFLAAIIDGIILNIAGWIIILVAGIGNLGALRTLSRNSQIDDPASQAAAKTAALAMFSEVGIICLVLLCLSMLYFSLMESSAKQATLGKLALSLKVTDVNGNRLTFGRALGRNLGKFISSLILYIGYIMAAFTQKKQALHDMMAGTLVLSSSNAVSPQIAQQAYAQPAQS